MILCLNIFSHSFTVFGPAIVFHPVYCQELRREGGKQQFVDKTKNLAWHFLNLLEKSLLHADWYQFSGEHVFWAVAKCSGFGGSSLLYILVHCYLVVFLFPLKLIRFSMSVYLKVSNSVKYESKNHCVWNSDPLLFGGLFELINMTKKH